MVKLKEANNLIKMLFSRLKEVFILYFIFILFYIWSVVIDLSFNHNYVLHKSSNLSHLNDRHGKQNISISCGKRVLLIGYAHYFKRYTF